jgi:colicin import membrane protein
MNAAALKRDAFMPHPPRGMGSGLVLALLVHTLLVAALAFSVNWRASSPAVAEAELWAAVPQMAAPRAAEVEPPKPVVQPVKPPPPVPRAEPEPQKIPDANIAIEKAKREEAKREQLKEKEEAALKKKEVEKERKAEEALVEARERNIKRILGQAEATGSADAKGSAQQNKAPSAEYAGRVVGRVRPQIEVPREMIDGNPVAEVEVRCAPDGHIVSKRLIKPSGVRIWDEGVLRAIDKTEVLPLEEGRCPSPMILSFRPRD